MIVKSPKLFPKTIIELAAYYKVRILEAYYKVPDKLKSEMRGLNGQATSETNKVQLMLQSIMYNNRNHRDYWLELLTVFLHEVGHLRDYNMYVSNYDKQHKHFTRDYCRVEKFADDFAEREIARLMVLNGALFEPKSLGIFDIITNKSYKASRENKQWNCMELVEHRSRKVGCQYALWEVINKIFFMWNVPTYQSTPDKEPGNKKVKEYFQVRKIVLKLCQSLKIGKIYIDHAKREHYFFNYGEVESIKRLSTYREISKLLVKKEEIKKNQIIEETESKWQLKFDFAN